MVPRIERSRDRNLAEYSQYFLQRASTDRQTLVQSEKRIGILLRCLNHPRFYQNSLFYLSNEFKNQPVLATLDVVSDMIANSSNQKCTHDLARLRWKAGGIENPQLVVSDMSHLRKQFSKDVKHSAAEALEYTIWSRSTTFNEHNEACLHMVNDTESPLADLADMLSLSANEMSEKSITLWETGDVSLLIPLARTGFDSEMTNKWRPAISTINSKRMKSLEKLQSLETRFPFSVSIFCSGLKRFAMNETDSDYANYPSQDILRKEVATLLRRPGTIGFDAKHKITVAEFCIENQISPVTFGQLLDRFRTSNPENLFWREVFQKDTALNCVYYAGIAAQL